MNWLTKFKISSALDAEETQSASLMDHVARSKELRDFAQTTQALDRMLKAAAPKYEAPRSIHTSIMTRVAGHAASAVQEPALPLLRWFPAVGFAALVLLGVWWSLGHVSKPSVSSMPTAPPPLALASTTLEIGDEVTKTAPLALMQPMSNELDRLRADLKNTADFLLASVP